MFRRMWERFIRTQFHIHCEESYKLEHPNMPSIGYHIGDQDDYTAWYNRFEAQVTSGTAFIRVAPGITMYFPGDMFEHARTHMINKLQNPRQERQSGIVPPPLDEEYRDVYEDRSSGLGGA